MRPTRIRENSMKTKFFVFLIALIASIGAIMAQDIIVTTESERIDAQITEVSETEIKYKRANNPNGPTFVISTSKVASVIYKNGDVQTFKQQTNQNNSTSTDKNNVIVKVKDVKEIAFVPGQKLIPAKEGGLYYGNILLPIENGQYEQFLKLNCPDAYKQYKTGMNMVVSGLTVGGVLAAVGFGLMFGSIRPHQPENDALLISGGVLVGAGVISGVTLYCVGHKKWAYAHTVFNKQCVQNQSYSQDLTLKMGITQNGLGLTLNF